MQVSPRTISQAVSDGTGMSPEQLGLVVAGALALAGVMVALRTVDFVSRHLPKS